MGSLVLMLAFRNCGLEGAVEKTVVGKRDSRRREERNSDNDVKGRLIKVNVYDKFSLLLSLQSCPIRSTATAGSTEPSVSQLLGSPHILAYRYNLPRDRINPVPARTSTLKHE